MITKNLRNTIIWLTIGVWAMGCSNQKNTFLSRNYHAMTTHYNIYFNGKESLKDGVQKMAKAHQENYAEILPVFVYQDEAARAMANGDMDRVIEKASKAVKLHSVKKKPKRKNGKKSQKYKDFRKKNEFNVWIDDCYLLMGKAHFYKKEYADAIKIFRYIVREYPESELIPETQLWWSRCLVDQQEYSSALQRLNSLMAETGLSASLRLEVYGSLADLFIRKNEFETAVSYLEQALRIGGGKYLKLRYRYIIAQLYLEAGESESASRAFRSLIRQSSSYEMAFNARVNLALSYNGQGAGEEIRKELKKMLRDGKNIDYLDQIHYALAEMDIKDGNIEDAVENYWMSTSKSIYNDNQKALSFLKLGEHYFQDLNYRKAQICYDSSMVYLDSEYPQHETLSVRVEALDELIENLKIVEREDSLQRVAMMSPPRRDDLIADLIAQIDEREQQKEKEKQDALMDRQFFSQNDMLGDRRQLSSSQGNWYFYNPTTVGVGKSDFQRKWGRRKFEDNWRRKDRRVIEISDESEDNISEDPSEKPQDIQLNPRSKEFYLAGLPLNDSLMQLSDARIVKGLFKAASVYDEKLNDSKAALKTLEELIARYPESSYLLSALYSCYSINKREGDMQRATYFKNRILKEFPKSNYANEFNDPNYYAKIKEQSEQVNQLYEKVLDAYNNYYYPRVIELSNEAVAKFPDNNLCFRFLFLRALAVGHTQSIDNFRQALQQVLDARPDKQVKNNVESILTGIDRGEIPAHFTDRDMENARQNLLLTNREPLESGVTEPQGDNPRMSINVDNEIYQLQDKNSHLFVILFSKDNCNPNQLLFNISKYNVNSFRDRTFQTDLMPFNEKQVMVVVKGLKNKSDALKYLNGVVSSDKTLSLLNDVDYRNFVISDNNFEILIKDKDIESYMQFYMRKYYDKSADVPAREPGSSEKVDEESGSKRGFKVDMADNHKFVLVVPSRDVNINKLRARIYNHDKDFKVLKESYDQNLNMIVVPNLGNYREAMNYFKKIVEDREVYRSLENADYKNFIISYSNFEDFYVEKQLDEYIDFFKTNYLKGMASSKEAQTEKVVKDGIYTYKEKEPHYFALIYPSKGVNAPVLESGIRKYNNKSLEIEIESLDEQRSILLVSNMIDKKQAMIYFRAVISNQTLFKPVENVEYRNFVISQDNLNVLFKDGNISTYINFFKKWYLQ